MRLLPILPLMFALGGCVTPYQDMGARGGVSAEAVTNDVIRISARGNGYTDQKTVQDYVLLKAAETTVERRATHFQIVQADDATSSQIVQSPGTYSFNRVGRTTFGVYNPGMVSTIIRPGKDVMVRILPVNAPSSDKQQGFDAREIIANVGTRVVREDGGGAASEQPSILIDASSKTVRDRIVARAEGRGSRIVENKPGRIVIEQTLSATPPALAAQCGAHKEGRVARTVGTLQERGRQTLLTESHEVVDDGQSCPVTLTKHDYAQAQARLQSLRSEVVAQAR